MRFAFIFLSCIPLTIFSSIYAAADSFSAGIDAYLLMIAPDGGEALELAEVTNLGEVILSRSIFENQAESALGSVRPMLPISVGLEYTADSLSPQQAYLDPSSSMLASLAYGYSATTGFGVKVDE